MAAHPMTNPQAAPADWEVPPGTARRLAPAATARVLRVTEGRLWATRSGRPEDCWLQAGERLLMPAGEELVVEGWPQARFELLLAAPPLSRAAPGAASRRRAGLLVLPPPFGPRVACSPCAS